MELQIYIKKKSITWWTYFKTKLFLREAFYENSDKNST